MMLSAEMRERYRRQLSLPAMSEAAQERLAAATVLVAGVGGLGGTVAIYLAAAGVGRLILYHDGSLTRSNLNRQILMEAAGVGRPRVSMAAAAIRRFNPDCRVEERPTTVFAPTLAGDLAAADVAVDARHNFPERRHLARLAWEAGKPLVEAAMSGMEATLTVLMPGFTPCLDCLYPEDPAWDPMGFPVLGAVSGALGALAALETVKLLADLPHPLLGDLLYADLSTLDFRRLPVYRSPSCQGCPRP